MKILVTGATGGLGRIIIPKLLDLNIEVVITSRSIEKAKELSFFNDVSFVPYDLNKPKESNLFLYFNSPDSVIHLAWDKLDDYKNFDHITLILENHKKFLTNLISNGLKDFNGIGTCYEYGLIEGELRETMSSMPVLPYSVGKNALREHIQKLKLQYLFDFKWIRIFYVFGEVYGRKNLYSALNNAINLGQKSFNMSSGEQIRDFLSPNEISDIVVKIVLQRKVQGIINCCSGHPVKLKDFVYQYLLNKNVSIQLNLGYYPDIDYEPYFSWGSTDKLKLC